MAQNINIRFNVNGNQTVVNIDKINKSLGQLATRSGGIAKTNSAIKKTGAVAGIASRGVKSLAGSLAGLVVAYSGFSAIATATRDLIEFNKAIAEVQTIAGLTPKKLGELKTSLLGISAATGKSAAEATRTFYQIQSAGITDVTKAQKTLEASLKLSVGSLANSETTTLALTKAMAVYEDSLKGPTEAADILFRGVELGQTRMEDLAMAIPQVLGPAKNLGITFADLTGAVASFSKRAGSTSIAVTQLQSIFSGLSRNQERAQKILGTNSELFSFQALRAKGLTNFLKDLTNAVGGSSTALFELFGRKEAVVGTLSAYADGFKDLGDTIVKARDNTGAADRAFQKILDSIGGQIDLFRSKFKAIILNFGITGEDSIVAILKSINDGLDFIANNTKQVLIKIKAALITIGVVAFARFSLKAITALKAIRLELGIFGAGAVKEFSMVRTALVLTQIKVKALALSFKILKAGLTLGLTLILDVLIEKFLTLKEDLGGSDKVFQYFKLQAQIAFKNVEIFAENLILKFQELRLKGIELLNQGVQKLGALVGLKVKPSGIENITTAVNNSKMAIKETTGELKTLEVQLDNLQNKKFGTGELLRRPAGEPTDPFALPGDRQITAPLLPPDQITGDKKPGIPGVPSIDQVDSQLNEIKQRVALFNEETRLLSEEREQLASDKRFEFLREKLGAEEAFKIVARKQALKNLKQGKKAELEIEQKVAEQRKKITIADLKFSELSGKQKLQQTQNTLSLGVQLATAAGKKFFGITKALSLSEAIVSGILAVQKAYASAPFPLNIINAGIVGGLTAINTAKIASSKPPSFRTGGVVPGVPTGGRDSVLAQVEPRETILTRTQTARLFNLANGAVEPEGQTGVIGAINNLANAIMNQSTSIEIDGRQVALAIRDQRLAGVAI